MKVLKHTDFMGFIAQQLPTTLPTGYPAPNFGETRWLCQVYWGEEKRIHYEVGRVFNRLGRVIEIGLHFETRDPAYNRACLLHLDQHLLSIQAGVGQAAYADFWDKGWTKIYCLHKDADQLTEVFAQTITDELALFVQTVQPIFASHR